jgi:uncharacterized protein (TIGR01777 family)
MTDATKATAAPINQPLRIVLPGGSGQIGQILARHFHAQGHNVTVLTRTPKAAPWRVLAWDAAHLHRWVKELDGADVLLNLTGRSVNCRYNGGNRREILESRIGPTRLLGEAIAKLAHPPRLWMNASTATIYRHALDRTMDEATGELGGNETDAPSSWRFSIDVATRWEECFFAAATPQTRKIALRSAMIMSPDRGGTFDLLLRLVRFGLGGTAGPGTQFMSWIHDSDFVRAVDHLIARPDIHGAVNLAAPGPLPNCDFMRALRDASGRRFGLPASKWMLEFGAIFLRTETELILKSRRVVPTRLLDYGFRFEFPEWPAAARELVGRWSDPDQSTETQPGATLHRAAGVARLG